MQCVPHSFDLMLRSPPKAGVSKREAASSFETPRT